MACIIMYHHQHVWRLLQSSCIEVKNATASPIDSKSKCKDDARAKNGLAPKHSLTQNGRVQNDTFALS